MLIFKAADIDMKPGSNSAAGTIGVIPAPGGHYRYESPLPGVILYEWRRGDYAPTPEFKREEVSLWDKLKRATGLDGWELAILAIVVGGAVILVAPEAAPALAPAL
jgi:hypothetical protein